MTHKSDRKLVGGDPRTVVADPDRRPPRAPHVDVDASGVRVESVFQKLFDHRGRPLDHLAGCDRVRDLGSEQTDRLAQGDSLARGPYSFCSASSGLRAWAPI